MNAPTTDAELEQLATEAQSIGATVPPLGQGTTDLDTAYADQQQQPAAITNAQAIASALEAGREAFCLFTKLQSPRATLDDPSCEQLGDLWGRVLDKRGINLARYMGDYAAEIAAAMATFAVAKAVHAGVQAELAQRRKEEPADQPAAAPATADGSAE